MNNLAKRIVEYMHSKKYLLFNGAQHANIIYIEGLNANGTVNSDAPNCFNDRRLVLQTLNGIPQIIGNWEATTEPGSHYTYSPMNKAGAARIKFGQYTAWRVGMHGTRDRHEALVQVANVTVHRDFNKDFIRTGDRIDTGLFGINQHWGYDLPLNNIATASAGCLVGRSRGGHREFMNLVKSDVRYKKDPSFIFTSTIIPGDELTKLFPGDSFQGLVGVRPTRGLVSLDGIIPYALSRDNAGPMARTVTDAAITLNVMAQNDPNNPGVKTLVPAPVVEDKSYTDYTDSLDLDDLKGARLGVVGNYFGVENGVDPEVDLLMGEALDTIRDLGATTVDVNFDNSFLTTMSDASRTIARAEQKPYLEEYLATLEDSQYPKTVEDIIAILESPEVANSETPSIIIGTLEATSTFGGLDNPDYINVAKNVIPELRKTVLQILESNDLDALVFPTIGTFARPLIGTTDPTFVSPPGAPPIRQVEFASLLGFADITVPAGLSEGGLPVTLSFTGKPYSEETLLGLAYSFEQETMFRIPPDSTPSLAGEIFEYEPVPEPTSTVGFALFGLTALAIKFKKQQKVKSDRIY